MENLDAKSPAVTLLRLGFLSTSMSRLEADELGEKENSLDFAEPRRETNE
jgi:hypothetical protein